jgi:hypothetical protein
MRLCHDTRGGSDNPVFAVMSICCCSVVVHTRADMNGRHQWSILAMGDIWGRGATISMAGVEQIEARTHLQRLT